MSAGAFEAGRYETTKTPTRIVGMSVQPETKDLTIDGTSNAYPAGPVDSWPSAQVSRGARSIGINARTVTVKFTGTPPTGYKPDSPITLPWFDATTFNAIASKQTGTYLSTAIVVVGTRAEKVR